MRLFFGVPIENTAQKSINCVITDLEQQFKGRYTDIDNLHITLTFIGEVDTKLLYMLSNIGDIAFSDMHRFCIETGDIASFKDGKVNYLSLQHNEELLRLHNALNTLLDEAGVVYNRENEYTPHITLRRGAKTPMDIHMEPMAIEVDRVCLFESTRVDDVLRYIPVRTWEARER